MNDIEIIAEMGVNHNGVEHQALELIEVAKKCGCDTVKFQLFHGNRYPELQLTIAEMKGLKVYAEKLGLRFLCTPDTVRDAEQLKNVVGVDRIKIGSSNITNTKLLQRIRDMDFPAILLSTGACTSRECWDAVLLLKRRTKLTVMHCLSAYPAPNNELNLSFIRELFGWPYVPEVGFSDHTLANFSAALMALALGARVFEKHLTLNCDQTGPDHHMSLDPVQMHKYVCELRAGVAMLGDGEKRVMPSEEDNRKDYEQFVREQRASLS